MENMAFDRVYQDLETATGPVSERQVVPFTTFLNDQIIMNYGLYSLAIKNMMQMVNGLKCMTSMQPFGY